jgi:hypothetical protein
MDQMMCYKNIILIYSYSTGKSKRDFYIGTGDLTCDSEAGWQVNCQQFNTLETFENKLPIQVYLTT